MFKEVTKPDVERTHFGQMEELEEARKKVEELNPKDKQLDRIEGMLTSIILHFRIQYPGIITIPNPNSTN